MSEIVVSLIDKMGSDKRVTNIARTSFNKWLPEDEGLSERDIGLLNYLATGLPSSERDDWEKQAKAHVHFAPYCHCFLTLRCKVPIFLARQIGKHQIGLVWSEESRRYITDPVELWFPEVVHKAPESAKQGASVEVHTEFFEYDEWEDATALDIMEGMSKYAVNAYEMLIKGGVAPEEARIILPQNAMVNFIWSGSLLAFNRVYQQRADSHAQKSGTQEFAKKLGGILYKEFPESMKALNYGKEWNE